MLLVVLLAGVEDESRSKELEQLACSVVIHSLKGGDIDWNVGIFMVMVSLICGQLP